MNSLVDALLLDAYRLDVWIALRNDAVKGSGTEQDPWNGGVASTPAISATMTRSGNTATATAVNHGFKNGDLVLIAGATGADAKYYNGTFSISNVFANTFDYTMPGIPQSSPATGTCQLDPYLFDAVMRSLPGSPPLTVHLGPGTFETKGYSNPARTTSWTPRNGMKIVASGIDVTVLKLAGATFDDEPYFAIGGPYNNYLDSFEASDFTVDCNLSGQPVPAGKDFLPVGCGAVYAVGKHTRLRRIRVINFGTQTLLRECFGLFGCSAHPDLDQSLEETYDCVIEDCIVEQPAVNNVRETTCINMGGGERTTDGVTAYHRASVVRNCLVDCEYRDKPVSILQIAISGTTTATVTTRLPHGRVANDWVRISGAMVNDALDNPYNGSFRITNATSTTFQYTMQSIPSAQPNGDMWVGRFSSQFVPISSVSKASGPGSNWTVTITTATPHYRVPGNNVLVNQVYTVAFPSPNVSPYVGTFKVEDDAAWNPKKLKYLVSSDPGTWTPSGLEFIGVVFQAMANDAGTAAVVEGNRVLNTRVGGPYHDFYTTKDLTVRNNYYRAVVHGPVQSMVYVSSTSDYIPVSLSLSAGVVTATTVKEHGFTANVDSVYIAGVTGTDAALYNGLHLVTAVTALTFKYAPSPAPTNNPSGSPGYATQDQRRLLNSLTSALESGEFVATAESSYLQHGLAIGDAVLINKASRPQYNGYFSITGIVAAIPGTNNEKFKYKLPSNPGGSSTSGYFGRMWQAGRVVIENNIIELIPTPTNWGPPAAIFMGYANFALPPLFRQVVIRGNIIRHVDGLRDPVLMAQGGGIQITGCGELIVEENVIDLDRITPIEYALCDEVKFFNNRTSGGLLIQAYETSSSKKASELITDIEDALVLSL
jgi:hypothetical protein